MVQICAHQGLRYRQFLVKDFFFVCLFLSVRCPEHRDLGEPGDGAGFH